MKKVFTFWEPKESVPGYVRLCMDTWARNLPGYEVVVLDYQSLGEYLTPEEQSAAVWKGMTFAMQSDCIRCAVLKKHGGIWLDADTVLTRPLDGRFSRSDVTMIARRMNGMLVNYGAFINAAKPEARFLCDWYSDMTRRVAKARECRDGFWFGIFHHHERRLMFRWDYCVNAVIDPLAASAAPEDYAWLDKDEVFALPEEELITPETDAVAAYRKYWFEPGDVDDVVKRCAGIMMLHNSFTPEEFRTMTADEFMATDTRLSGLLRWSLGR